MANLGNWIQLEDASDVSLKGAAKTATFTTADYSFSFNPKRVGIWLDLTVTGTSPTLNIDFELTMDGATYGDFAQAADTITTAEPGQITATGAYLYWIENAVPFGDDTTNFRMRLECTIGGTNPSFTFNEARLFAVA